MRPLKELINLTDPAWPLVQQWIAGAINKVQVLPRDSIKACDALYKTQVTTKSPMGAIIYMTGGILIDNGWIRVLGSGNKKLNRTVPDWNKGKSFKEYGDEPKFLLIADDAVGGFFAINGGKFGADFGKIYYLSPLSLKWEDLHLGYTQFLDFCFNGNLSEFYSSLRWKNWANDVTKINCDEVYYCFPYLWSKEGNDINKDTRTPVPIVEQYTLMIEMRKNLGL